MPKNAELLQCYHQSARHWGVKRALGYGLLVGPEALQEWNASTAGSMKWVARLEAVFGDGRALVVSEIHAVEWSDLQVSPSTAFGLTLDCRRRIAY
jgi:hypothetical protein